MKKTFLLLIFSSILGQFFAQNYAIGSTTITFNDPSRTGGFGSGGGSGRQIQTEIYYPALVAGTNAAVASGTFPVIVFGHGFAMSWDAYQNIWQALVPQGYIVAFPRTEGSLIPAPSHGNFGLDLALVETKIQNLNGNSGSIFYQKVLPNSALMGHSMGGGATFLGAANNSSPTLKAVVGLAPAESNPSAISAASNVSFDALIMSGSSDGVTPPNANHQPIYNNLTSSCKTFLSITNGSHCYFANSNFNCDFGELTTGAGSLSRNAQQDITADYLKLWLAFELKSSCKSWDEFLDSLAVSTRVVEQQSCSYGYLQPNVTLSGASDFCDGESLTLSATSNPAYSYSWYSNNQNVAGNIQSYQSLAGGSFLVTATNSLGCVDSSNVLNLTLHPNYYIQESKSACLGSAYVFPDGNTCTTDSTHLSNLSSQFSCDSTIETTVTFSPSVSAYLLVVLCQGESYLHNGNTFNSDTIFTETLANGSAFGCDSITSFNLQFSLPDSVYEMASICEGENYLLPNGLFTNVADSYSINYANAQGCDSIYSLDLGVDLTPEIDSFVYNIMSDTFSVLIQTNSSFDSIYWQSGISTLIQNLGNTALFYHEFSETP